MDDPYHRSRGKRSHSHRDREYLEPSGRHKKFISEDLFNPPALPKPAPEERVIFISSSESDWERDRGRRDRERDKDSREPRLSPAQDALMQVHERILEGGFAKEFNLAEEDSSRGVTTRLLVPNSQVGCLLGKGGHIIEKMRQQSKTQIRILPRDDAPFCSMPNDEIVQIVGDANAVKKALRLISTQLFENPPRDRHPGASHSPSRAAFLAEETNPPHRAALSSRGSYSSGQHPKSLQLPPSDYGVAASGRGAQFHGSLNSLPEDKHELVFRILCPRDKIGGIIGKGGSIVHSLEDEIGVSINVCGNVPGSDERVVMISSVERPDDDISPAQEALLHVQTRIADLGSDKDAVITSRLLISANQVACLLGTGGSVIAEMRKMTGANIRIFGKDDLPSCANPTDEVVQIVGDIQNAREALVEVTKRLRSNLYYERPLESGVVPASLSNSTPQNRHDFLSLGQTDFPTSGVQNTGRSASSYVKSSPPGYWMEKDLLGGSRLASYESPSLHKEPDLFRTTGALITKTTVEVVLPHRVAGTIFGDGTKFAQIRQMSGAQVNFLDVRPGALEAVVEISGTPEQTQSAQSLLQAFIMRGQTSSLGYP
ncbi:hypothetical protein GOP47_0012299 [Adiantum capillus-veneris]|uniref:K Homology domain-containing protein n=1 Tax=Adiantum capillus-veneris TaxID=13818 RepID=A0A9D4UQE9_ADICA|nr:hypothetical protein GOP47_0012299 [Adiantum capillus-veneris]